MNLCKRCGRCCWNFKENKPEEACEHLAADLKTCLIHDDPSRQAEHNCVDFPKPYMTCDLPEDCGYREAWEKNDLV